MFDLFTYGIYLGLLFMLILLTYTAPLFVIRDKFNSRLNVNIFKSASFLTALLLISFIVGYRNNVGIDWHSYVYNFNSLKNFIVNQSDQKYEFLFFVINDLLASREFHYTSMFFIMAFISWFFYFKSVPSKILPFLIFFTFADELFFWSMNGVRQFVAIAIFFYSLKYINTKKWIVFVSLNLFGALFHLSALFLLPFYFIKYYKGYSQRIWLLVFTVSFFIGNTPILSNYFESFITSILAFLPYIEKYQVYFIQGYFESGEVSLGLGYYFKIIVNVLILFLSKYVIEKRPETKIYFIIFFIGTIIFNLFYSFQIIGRLNSYFINLRPIVLAFILVYLWKYKKFKFTLKTLVLMYFLIFLVSIYNSSNLCSPYNFDFLN